MTCREKLALEHPECINDEACGGCEYCPNSYGYLPPPYYCSHGENSDDCVECWDRELPEEKKEDKKMTIKDSGERREFATGAVRDIQEGKGRCDLMPLDILDEYLGGINITGIFCSLEELSDRKGPMYWINKFKQTADAHWLYAALHRFVLLTYNGDPFAMMLELSKHFEEGAKKYGENNWQKGIPVHCYIDSAVRHYLKHLHKEMDEPHDRAFCWNIVCAIWTCKNKPELNEYKKEEK